MFVAGRIETNWFAKEILQQDLLYGKVVSIWAWFRYARKLLSLLDHRVSISCITIKLIHRGSQTIHHKFKRGVGGAVEEFGEGFQVVARKVLQDVIGGVHATRRATDAEPHTRNVLRA